MTAPIGQRVAWFCSKVFITNEYATYLKTEAPPYVGLQILNDWRAGKSPLMALAQLQQANSSEGLTMLVLHSGVPHDDAQGSKLMEVADRAVDFTRHFSSGYRACEYLQELYNDFTCAWADGAGLHMRTDYTAYFDCQRVPASQRPCVRLYGVTPEEAKRTPGTVASVIFNYQPPRFCFSLTEQQLLLFAICGTTDEELAELLNAAIVTVRKRFERIYGRVEEVAPQLFPNTNSQDAKRGGERKRYLIAYLHDHLEELRPCRK
jgi:hypothetical protein